MGLEVAIRLATPGSRIVAILISTIITVAKHC